MLFFNLFLEAEGRVVTWSSTDFWLHCKDPPVDTTYEGGCTTLPATGGLLLAPLLLWTRRRRSDLGLGPK